MTTIHTLPVQPQTMSRAGWTLYRTLMHDAECIDDPGVRATQLMAVRDDVQEALTGVCEEIDYAVLEMHEAGATFRQIAEDLFIARTTVQGHIERARVARERG